MAAPACCLEAHLRISMTYLDFLPGARFGSTCISYICHGTIVFVYLSYQCSPMRHLAVGCCVAVVANESLTTRALWYTARACGNCSQ